jgi:hypothetical protein
VGYFESSVVESLQISDLYLLDLYLLVDILGLMCYATAFACVLS